MTLRYRKQKYRLLEKTFRDVPNPTADFLGLEGSKRSNTQEIPIRFQTPEKHSYCRFQTQPSECHHRAQ